MNKVTLKEYVNERIADIKHYIEFNERKNDKDFFAHKELELYQNAQKYIELTDELGCPLEVFYELLKERNYYFEYNEKVYYNKNCYINTVNVNDGFISVSVGNEELRKKYIFDVKLYFKDYKKTWWLKEDRSE